MVFFTLRFKMLKEFEILSFNVIVFIVRFLSFFNSYSGFLGTNMTIRYLSNLKRFPFTLVMRQAWKRDRMTEALRTLDFSEDLEMPENLYTHHFSGINAIPRCVLTSVCTNGTLPQSSHVFQYKPFLLDTTRINFQHQYLRFLHLEQNYLFLQLPEATLE